MNLGARTAMWDKGNKIVMPVVGLLLDKDIGDISGNFIFSLSNGSYAFSSDSPLAGMKALETNGFLATGTGRFDLLPSTTEYTYASFVKLHDGISKTTAWSYFGYGKTQQNQVNNLKFANTDTRYATQNYWWGNDSEWYNYFDPEILWSDWHSYVWVWDGVKHSIYVDGIKKQEFIKTKFPQFSRENLCLGRSSYSSDLRWDGLLSNIALYDKVLTEKQIMQFAKGGILAVTE